VAEVPGALAGRNALLVKRGAGALGLSGGFLRRNAPGCRGSGVCAFGCPTGAKQHAAASWLPRAEAAGARVLAGIPVRRVLVRRGRAVGVQARGLTVRAPLVVVACGALLTPGLLRRSGVRSPALGRHLTIHPASAARARFDEPIDPWDGVPQSYYVDALADEGIMLEGIAGPPDQAALATPGSGALHRERMLAARSTASFGVMVADSATGSVRELGGRLLVRYDLHPDDAERLRRGFALLADIWWAVGAREVLVPLAGVPALRRGDSGPLHRARAPARRQGDGLPPAGHSARWSRPGALGRRPRPAGPRRAGLYLADGSAVPSSPQVNPQVTIMALAVRLGRALAGAPDGTFARMPA
jgi:GMC oxidoreductase